MAGAWILQKQAHVTMDIFSSHFSPRVKAIIDIVTCFLGFSFLIILIWKGGARAMMAITTNEHSTSVWAPTMIPFYCCLPLGAGVFALQYLGDLVRNIMVLIKGEEYLER